MDNEQKRIVSVIEDDLVFCRVLQEHIEAYGYKTAIHNTVEDFLLHSNVKSHAIILDHFLKDKTGYDSLDQIRKRMRGTPIIYLTKLSKGELPVDFDKSGIHAYIGKDSASLVRLRTILDSLGTAKKGFLQRLFKRD